jgi:hypothetical protein
LVANSHHISRIRASAVFSDCTNPRARWIRLGSMGARAAASSTLRLAIRLNQPFS